MRLQYYPETKSLYIKLAEGTYCESEEIVDGIVVDFTKEGKVLALDIHDASGFDMSVLEVEGFDVPISAANERASESVVNGQPVA
jgi:uncharacterized protein YuzE